MSGILGSLISGLIAHPAPRHAQAEPEGVLASVVESIVAGNGTAAPAKRDKRKTIKQQFAIRRELAAKRGEKYYTGHPCVRHPEHVINGTTKRTTSNGRCLACVSIYNKTPSVAEKKKRYAESEEGKRAKSMSRKRAADLTPEEHEQRRLYTKAWRMTDKGVAAANRALAKRAAKHREAKKAASCSR